MADETYMSGELINLVLMEQVVRSVEKISSAVEKLGGQVKETGEEAEKHTDKQIEQQKRLDRAFDEVNKRFVQHQKDIGEVKKGWDDAERAFSKYATEMKNKASSLLPSGEIAKLAKEAVGNLPYVGGFMQFLMWGAGREEGFRAATRRALYPLQALGRDATSQVESLNTSIKGMASDWVGAMGEAYAASIQAFSSMSIGTEQFGKASISAKGFHDSIMGVATAIDALNDAQPGTTAKLIGETMLNASLGPKEASDQVFKLANSLRDAGLNYGVFSQGIVQANSALRLQNQTLDDTTKQFLKLEKAYEAQGMQKERAGALALSGIQGQAQMISGLSEGMLGFMGRNIQKKGGLGGELAGITSPAALIAKLKVGMNDPKAFMSEMKQELFEQTKRFRGSGTEENQKYNQIYALASMTGKNFEAARAAFETGNIADLLADPAEQTATHVTGLDQAFSNYAGKFSEYDKVVQETLKDMADIANDLLAAVIGGFQVLPALFDKLAGDVKVGPRTQQQQAAGAVVDAYLSRFAKMDIDGRFFHAIGRIAGTVGTAGANANGSLDKARKDYDAIVQNNKDANYRERLEKSVQNLDLEGLSDLPPEARARLVDMMRDEVKQAVKENFPADKPTQGAMDYVVAGEAEKYAERHPTLKIGNRMVNVHVTLQDAGPAGNVARPVAPGR